MRNKKGTIRNIALALIAVSLLATASFAGIDSQSSSPKVSVQFVSRPDYADLYIDGKFVGSTDLALRIPPGDHVIEIKRSGYETWQRELIVTPENPTRVAALLRQEKP